VRYIARISKDDQPITVTTSNFLADSNWSPIEIDREPFEIRYESRLLCYFIRKKDSSVERVIRLQDLSPAGTSISGEYKMTVVRDHPLARNSAAQIQFAFDAPGQSERMKQRAQQDAKILSPMTGKVLRIVVSEGQSLSEGEPVVILEAMKMENKIVSPINGKVSSIMVSETENISINQLLLVITP
jgi:biotin carboxyl carrier protein